MKKNSKKLDYLIGSLWINKHDNRELKMVVDIEYIADYNRVTVEILSGVHAGLQSSIHQIDLFNYHRELK